MCDKRNCQTGATDLAWTDGIKVPHVPEGRREKHGAILSDFGAISITADLPTLTKIRLARNLQEHVGGFALS